MTATDRRVDSGLAFGLGLLGLLLDFTGWYTVAGAVLGGLGLIFALLMPRGRLRRTALWVNALTVAVAAGVLFAFFV